MEINTEIFKELPPTEFYILYLVSSKQNVKEMIPSLSEEGISFYLKKLEEEKYIKIGENNQAYIRTKGLNILNLKKNPSEIELFAEEYRNCFKRTAPGAMGDKNTLITNLKRFFSLYDYSFEHVLQAIKLYVQRESNNNNYRYLQKSHYTVFKKVNNSEESRLLTLCEELKDNEERKLENESFYDDI